jgi:predicted dehydrogenase
MKGTIRWGIIGCGDVTEVKSGPGFQKSEHSELAAVMRRDGKLAEDYARRHGVPRWYNDAQALIDDPEVDAVYIATPPGFHKEYTLAAAKAGKPVYVEKPMALNYQECIEMVEGCNRQNVPLFVAYYRRAQPRFLKVKQLIEEGAIGRVLSVISMHLKQTEKLTEGSIPWRLKPELSGGGLFFDLASHTLDLLDFLLGPIAEVSGHASNQSKLYESEDIVTGSYLFQSGAQGTGVWCFSAAENSDINIIIGTEGKITFSTFDHQPITLMNNQGMQEWTIEQPQHVQQPLIQAIVKELLGKGPAVGNGMAAARTNWVMDQMIENYYRNK